MVHRIHVLYNVVAEVTKSHVRLIVDEPITLETWDSFKKKTNSEKFRERVSQLKKTLFSDGEGYVVLADKECPVRLGGGFAQLDKGKIILIKRDQNAPLLPLTFDVPAGLFDENWETPLEMMVAESVEILRLYSDTIYYVSFNKYNEALLSELEKIIKALHKNNIIIENIVSLPSRMIKLAPPVMFIDYLDTRIENVRLAFEYPSSSIEIIGFVEVLGMLDYAYGDGELNYNNELLNREIHEIDFSTDSDRVWRFFKVERESTFEKEFSLSAGVTSKAAAAFRAFNLDHILRMKSSELWDVL